MQELYQSNIKTENSYIENVSIKQQKDGDYSEMIEEFKDILKWVNRKHVAFNNVDNQAIKKLPSQYSYYMVKIQSLSNLVFKKCYPLSKVYITITVKLTNIKSSKHYPKTIRIVKVVEEVNTYIYQLKEPIILYFFTAVQSQIQLKIQVLLIQQEVKSQNSFPVFGSPQNIGTLQIDFLKQRKGKEKKFLIPSNDFCFYGRDAENTNLSNSFGNIFVIKSQAYKYLERIIPENTLCDPSDRIPGIMGYFLPISQNALTDFALNPDARGLRLQFTNIQLNSNLIREASSKAQHYMKNRFSLISKLTTSHGDILLHVYFHNGWKSVSHASSPLKEKGEIYFKTNQSNISDYQNPNNNKKKTSILKNLQVPIKIKSKSHFKNYSCEVPIELKLTFPQQQQCVIIYQISMEVVAKGEIQNSNKKEETQLIQQTILIPICFGISSAKAISNFKSMACLLNEGGCLTSFQNLKQVIESNLKKISQIKQPLRTIVESKNKFTSALDIDTISNNKTLKTLDNISHHSIKTIKNQIGFIDLQMNLVEREDINTQLNLSLPMENFSSFNISKHDIKDKIQNQKERIAKESKKNLTSNNKLNKLVIDFFKPFIISQNQKQQSSSAPPLKINAYHLKEEFVKLLRVQIDKNYTKEAKYFFQKENTKSSCNIKGLSKIQNDPSIKIEQQNSPRIPYSIKIFKKEPQSICEYSYSKYFYYLYSNRILHEKYYFKYETVSLDSIKTELSEINYNNCYFINFVEMTNHANNIMIKFPKAFYFKMKFYNQEDIRSELMTINKDTGEILLFNSEANSSKIIHIQLNIDEEPSNSVMKFMQFIEFMHNGMLNVDIIDYYTGLSFGIFTIPLRSLIRKRRNEVIFVHQDSIYHRNMVRANMKVQLRAIRKMRHRPSVLKYIPEILKEPPIQDNKVEQKIQEKDLRLNRIQRYKQSKNKDTQLNIKSEIGGDQNQIAKILTKVYTQQSSKIIVSYLQKQFFFIEICNKHEFSVVYSFTINDEDKKWIQKNPISGEDEISFVKDPARLQKVDYDLLTASKKHEQKILKCLKINQEEQLQMGPRAKGYLLLCYLSVRRYSSQKVEKEQLSIFNRERTINCTFTNQKNGNIEVIHAVQVIPIPEQSAIELQYYRPAGEQSLIHIPFIDSHYLSANIDEIIIDDPYTIIIPASNISLPLIQRFTAISTGTYIQISNDLKHQQFKEFNILLLSNLKKKQALIAEGTIEKNKSKAKIQSRVIAYVEELEGPKLIRMILRVWGCIKISLKVQLWVQKEGNFSLNNQIFKAKGIKQFYLVSDDQQHVSLWQDKKYKYQHQQLLRVEESNIKTQVSYSISSHQPNNSYIHLNGIDLSEAIGQQESIKTKQFKYVQPFVRIVMQVETVIPSFKEMLKININRSSQGILEEPFTYRSSANKRTEFKIYSSDSSLVWVKNNDTVFQIEGKSEKKIVIHFNVDKITERNLLLGSCEGVVLGIKWEKGIDYYGFKFNIY